MKKIYLPVFLIAASLSGVAQINYSPSAVGRQYVQRGDSRPTTQQLPADRDVFYTNDFSNCNDWNMVNANDAGYTNFIAGINFDCGTGIAPSGPAAIDPIASPTADNGFVLVDSDLFGGSTGGDWVENCWVETANPINCSAYDHVSLSFYTFYRMWDGGASDGNEYCLVEISTDGVNWPDPNTFEVSEADPGTRFELWPTMQTQDPVDNPTLKIFDISAGAANQSTVYIRFRWKGTWGYSWMIDDMELFETPENDLTVLKTYNGDIVGDYEYYGIPEMQLGDLNFGAIVANFGYTDQNGVPVTFDVDGNSYGADATIAASTIDTVWTGPVTVPLTQGVYTVTATVPSDDFPEGDSYSKQFEITDYIYAQNSNTDLVQRGFDQDDEVAIGCTYYINQDTQAGGARLLFGSNTDANQELNVYLYEIGTDIQDLTYLAESGPFIVTSDMIGTGEYVNIGFQESGAVDVTAGTGYVLEVRKDESGDRLYVLANVLDEDLSTVNWGPFGTGDAINWYVGWNWSPAVQLVLDANAAVPESISNGSAELMQNVPNPAVSNTRIGYSLESPETVVLTVRDMTGRLVMELNEGVRHSGKNTIDLNVGTLTAGIYSYTLTAGTSTLTKEMIVR